MTTMIRRSAVLATWAMSAVVAPSAAQVTGQATLLFENYSFDAGLPFTSVSEISIPMSVSYAITPRADFTLSTGITSISVTSSGSTASDITVSGLTDSEARLTYEVLRDRVSVVLAGRLPTGIDGLEADQSTVLTVLATDVLGFATRSLGSGGSLGLGASAALPLGRMALGLAGTVTGAGSFSPVAGDGQELKPGTELRVRAGVEGPLTSTGYVRVAVILARRSDDQVNGQDLGVGTRFSGYASFEERLGKSLFTAYIFDQVRASPQVDATSFGGVLPKGNLFAMGVTVAVPIDRRLNLTPRIEFRRADQAPDVDSDLQKLGSSWRLGSSASYRVTPNLTVVGEASALTGSIASADMDIGTNGFRIGAGVRIRR